MANFNQTTIVVNNRTTSTLTLVEAAHHQGGFQNGPPRVIEPNTQRRFGSVEMFGKEKLGDDGYVIYDIGGHGRTFYTIHWTNLEDGTIQSTGSLHGDDAEHFDTADEMEADGGVATATFDLSDAPRLTEDDYHRDKPVEADEPTLRYRDESVDGWVEYLQRLLVVQGHGPLEMHGVFDDATLQAVYAFQRRKNTEPNTPSTGKVSVDGIVGNQTWALLREEDPRPPSTDGREPHTYVERGPEARWLTEDSAFAFISDDDRLIIQGVSTGDTPIESGVFTARFLIVLPSAETVVRDEPIFTPGGQPAQPGELIFAEIDGVADRARNTANPLGATTIAFEAYMPAELGGDATQGTVPFDSR